jgi:hypothetical protein
VRPIAAVLGASLTIAGVSTIGDFIWATWITSHHFGYGLAHGVLLISVIGLVLGISTGRPRAGATGGAAVGGGAAAVYYLLAPFFGFVVMFFVWAGLWMGLAFLFAHLNDRHPDGVVLKRGAVAAAASGLSFYLIAGIWLPFDPQGWDYALHFAAWTIAYFPGFAALMLGTRSDAPQDPYASTAFRRT